MSQYYVDILGFENRSFWGYDEGMDELFIQLYENESNNEEPDYWIMQSLDNIELFFIFIERVTGISVSNIYRILANYIPEYDKTLSNIFAIYIQEEIDFFPVAGSREEYTTRHNADFYKTCTQLKNQIIAEKAQEALNLLQSNHNMMLDANYE